MRRENYWDKISHTYDQAYKSTWSQQEDREISKLICDKRLVGRAVRVLDLGCGTGLGFRLLSTCFSSFDYVGVDASKQMLSEAMNNINELAVTGVTSRLICAPAMAALSEIEPDSFDLVIALNATASYIARTRPLMRESFRVVKPKGTVLLSFLNRFSTRRLVRHNTRKVKEMSVSRGEFGTDLSIPSVTVTRSELIRRISAFKPESLSLHYQSVLGGIWETDKSILLESVLRRTVPFLGHTISVLARRS